MGHWTNLTASDGHVLSTYVAGNADASRGIVIVQEVFGVNNHIRNVCERYAREGYLVVAPALFDRVEKGVELNYDELGVARGVDLVGRIQGDHALMDVDAAIDHLGDRKKGIVGFCWGGTLAWLAAARFGKLSAAVGFYGGGIATNKDIHLLVPVQLHFGQEDPHIPSSDVAAIIAAQPDVQVLTYAEAGHGFCCDERGSFHASSAALSTGRALDFLKGALSS